MVEGETFAKKAPVADTPGLNISGQEQSLNKHCQNVIFAGGTMGMGTRSSFIWPDKNTSFSTHSPERFTVAQRWLLHHEGPLQLVMADGGITLWPEIYRMEEPGRW